MRGNETLAFVICMKASSGERVCMMALSTKAQVVDEIGICAGVTSWNNLCNNLLLLLICQIWSLDQYYYNRGRINLLVCRQ